MVLKKIVTKGVEEKWIQVDKKEQNALRFLELAIIEQIIAKMEELSHNEIEQIKECIGDVFDYEGGAIKIIK